jgi:hypothetical protein
MNDTPVMRASQCAGNLIEGKSLRAMSGDVGLAPESVMRYGVQLSSAKIILHYGCDCATHNHLQNRIATRTDNGSTSTASFPSNKSLLVADQGRLARHTPPSPVLADPGIGKAPSAQIGLSVIYNRKLASRALRGDALSKVAILAPCIVPRGSR